MSSKWKDLTPEELEEMERQEELEKERDKEFNKIRRRRRILAVLLLILIIVLSWRIGTGGGKPVVVIEPDYNQVDIDKHAIPNNDKDSKKLEAAEGGGAVAISYSDKIIYDMASNMITLSYSNPYASTQSVILQIIIHGPDGSEYKLSESGVLLPGYRLETIPAKLDEGVRLSKGVYNGLFRLLFYNPETGERSIVNTEIPITITVQ